MSLIDRYIFGRFIANFVILFTLLFVFVIAIDVITNLDKFVEAARAIAGPNGGALRFTFALLALTANFQGPRLFQFYAYLHGLVAIGAMGFTLAQMHRYRELVAVMASGVSLWRVAWPFFIAVFFLTMLQLLNQELVLPKVAPLLLRGYGDIGERGANDFEVRFTPYGKSNLLQAPHFDPQTQTLTSPTLLERDDRGRTIRRIWASKAVWSEPGNQWLLVDGKAVRPQPVGKGETGVVLPEKIETYPGDFTPRMLLAHRYNQFAAMLSLGQIKQMLQTEDAGEQDASHRNRLLRYKYSRFSSILVNILVLVLTLPSFLLREPANLLRQSILCASLAIPATMGSAIGMMVELPGIPPALGVFLPVIALIPFSCFPWTFFKT